MGQSSSTLSLSPDMAAKLKTEIEAIIQNNGVVVFSKTYCPYCAKTKALLAKKNVKAHIVELDEEENGADIQALLFEITGQKSVPNNFIGGKHIGGNDSLQLLQTEGKLDGILANL
ncbi:hypothetical protein BGZ99_002259 [Dissophora globulifera]|uniref:Glutaredoxin domain-containing protein n=1 Tax=Dissophora globulifera TaxID=979702 RepID=A0A9P6UJ50_9FUNG|nr:hypothetical protein BGZ99_002259 [Dissophora globulifera]